MSWLRKLFGGGVDVVPAAANPSISPSRTASLVGQSLVVADPSLTIHKVVEMAMSDTGCTVASATEAGEILPLVWKLRPGTVLLAASFLRDDQLVPAIRSAVGGVRVVVMHGTFEPRDPAMASCDAALTKPFSPKDLLEAVVVET